MAIEKVEHDPTHGPKIAPVHVGGDSFLDRIVPHLKKIAVALVAVAAVLTVVFIWRWWKHSQAEEATEHLARALEVGDRTVIPVDIDLGDNMPDHFKTQNELAQATLAELGKAGQVRGAASLYEAHMLLQAGKLDEALARYRALGSGQGVDGAIAREGIAVVLEAKASTNKDPAQRQQQLEEALTAFRAIQTSDNGPRREYALYHEGRMLELLGKSSEAIAPLQQALIVAPETPLRSAIEMRLSALGASTASTAGEGT